MGKGPAHVPLCGGARRSVPRRAMAPVLGVWARPTCPRRRPPPSAHLVPSAPLAVLVAASPSSSSRPADPSSCPPSRAPRSPPCPPRRPGRPDPRAASGRRARQSAALVSPRDPAAQCANRRAPRVSESPAAPAGRRGGPMTPCVVPLLVTPVSPASRPFTPCFHVRPDTSPCEPPPHLAPPSSRNARPSPLWLSP